MIIAGVLLVLVALALAFGNVLMFARSSFDSVSSGDTRSLGRGFGKVAVLHGVAAALALIGVVLFILGVIDYAKA